MRGMPSRVVGGLLLVLVAAACGGCSRPLVQMGLENGPCFGVGLDAVLSGSPTDPRVAWLTPAPGSGWDPGTTELEIAWPSGYTARFAPRLEILDASGAIVLREGDAISGGCVIRASGRPLLQIRPHDQVARQRATPAPSPSRCSHCARGRHASGRDHVGGNPCSGDRLDTPTCTESAHVAAVLKGIR